MRPEVSTLILLQRWSPWSSGEKFDSLDNRFLPFYQKRIKGYIWICAYLPINRNN
jgi:hypothetical protein